MVQFGYLCHFSMKKLLILTTVVLIKLASSKKVDAHEVIVPSQTKADFAECLGSLLVVTESGELRFGRTKTLPWPTKLIENSLEVEGCGCFELYNRRNFKGTSFYISHYMGYISGDYVGFTIRSVEKVPCNEYTKSIWGFRRVLGDAPRHHRQYRMHQPGRNKRV